MILRSICSGWGNILDGREGQTELVFPQSYSVQQSAEEQDE